MRTSLFFKLSVKDKKKLNELLASQHLIKEHYNTNRGEEIPGIVFNVDFSGESGERGVISIHDESLEGFKERDPIFKSPTKSMEAA